ncbi:MAG: hypothetical protein ACRDSP_00360 [Pseudonocardiaceae bacterium]
MTGEAQAAVVALEAALSGLDLGVPTDATARPGPAVAADLNRLNSQLRPATNALYITDPEHHTDVLRGLMDCYHAAGVLLKNLGVRGLPTLAASHARRVAEELDDPAWFGLAAWLRASTIGGKGRPRMSELSVQGADALHFGPDNVGIWRVSIAVELGEPADGVR